MKEIFNRNPFDFTTCPDIEEMDAEKQFFADCKLQFENISKLVNEFFPQKSYGIDKSQVILEPGFLCETLGLQGRLDLLMQDYTRFIELKSGKAKEFPPPLSHRENHYVQMMLYFAVLHYNMGVDVHKVTGLPHVFQIPRCSIPSRPYWSLVKTAVEVRNRIVLCDYDVQRHNDVAFTRGFLANLKAATLNEKGLTGRFWETYLQPDIDKFEQRLKNLSSLESDYFHRLYNFITKEQFVSKTGSGSDYDANRGIFTLWNASLQEKIRCWRNSA